MEVIPFRTFPNFTETVTLDNITYQMTFRWNHRGEFWVASVAENDGTVIASGIRIVLNYEMIRNYADLDLPPGGLYVADAGGIVTSIGRLTLSNGEASLAYVPETEYAEL